MTRPADMHPVKWTDADFDSLSWHDCKIHSLGLDQDGEEDEYQNDLVLDLDFIIEWLLTPGGQFRFRLAPACLRFHNVDKLDLRIVLDCRWPIEIFEVTRVLHAGAGYPTYRWTIKLNTIPDRGSRIEFDATGFTQELTACSLVTDRQCLKLAERSRMIHAKGEQHVLSRDSHGTPPANSDAPDGPAAAS